MASDEETCVEESGAQASGEEEDHEQNKTSDEISEDPEQSKSQEENIEDSGGLNFGWVINPGT